jgi:aspartyl-tRNA(Asn)/glutamyl-tRNA(Gln) amidotransferase subunit A
MERGWLTKRLDDYGEKTRSLLLQGKTIPAVDYLRAQQQRRAFSSNLRSIMQGFNALVLPTIPMPAILIEQAATEILIDGVTQNATVALLRLTMPFNLAGLPAISLPCGFSAGGLPIGLQIAGKPFEESMILRIAHAYQQLTDWHHREINIRPKI